MKMDFGEIRFARKDVMYKLGIMRDIEQTSFEKYTLYERKLKWWTSIQTIFNYLGNNVGSHKDDKQKTLGL
jgi:hypothetical protein